MNGAEKKPATIMVVDDESTIRDLCEMALKNFRVIKAGSCEQAVRMYETETVDLVLTDVMMPGGTGLELLDQIKEHDPQAAVIVMTGFSEKQIVLSALKKGASDFINKPLNLLQLTTAVEKVLARQAIQKELADLKNLDHLKSNFLSMISHKLRTPITGISLFLQNMQRGVFQADDAEFQQSLTLVSDEANYLGRMVSDLLVFSQVMDGKDSLLREPCDLNRVIRSILRGSQVVQYKSGIETDFQEADLPELMLDKAKTSFALHQIIENAYKFSGEIGTVSIAVRHDLGKACIIVSDSGVGIAPNEITKVFEKFYQIDPDVTGQIRGFGLGLYYAREFVRQHGGGISIDSEPGLGTTVTVTLPID
jgi:signal transduction histidine kinase